MAARNDIDAPPEEFRKALDQLKAARLRPEIFCEEMPAPQRIAPYSAAMTADITVGGEDVGGGRLVLLYDPAGNDAWQGNFRCVAYARADIDPEMVTDPLLGAVGWSWLIEALTAHQRRVPGAQRHRHPGRLRELRRHGRRARQRRDRSPRLLVTARLGDRRTSRPGATCCAPPLDCHPSQRVWSRCPAAAANGLDERPGPTPVPDRTQTSPTRRGPRTAARVARAAASSGRDRRRAATTSSNGSAPARGPFAIDAERASGYRYSHRAYLVQLRRAGAGTALIDPIPFGDVPNTSMQRPGRGDRRRRVDHPRREPGPPVPGRARAAAAAPVRHRAGRPAAQLPARRPGRADRGAARLPDAQGALGRRLVPASASRAVADVRRARRRAAGRAARRAAPTSSTRPASASGPSRSSPCGPKFDSAPGPSRAVAAYVGHPSGSRPARARPRAGDVGAARSRSPAAATSRPTGSSPTRPSSRPRRPRRARATRWPAAGLRQPVGPALRQGVRRCDQRRPSSSPDARSARRSGQQHDGPPPPRSWADKNPPAAERLGRCREVDRRAGHRARPAAGEPRLPRLRPPPGLGAAGRRYRRHRDATPRARTAPGPGRST